MMHKIKTRVFIVAAVFLCVSERVSAIPVGGTPDPFMLDRSPRALEFREAYAKASQLATTIDQPPAGVTGTEHRRAIVESLENAVSIMPEAPMVPYIRVKIGYLWMYESPKAGVQPEISKSLGAFAEVKRGYPENHKEVLDAMWGTTICYETNRDFNRLMESVKEIEEYDLPEDADDSLRRVAERIGNYARDARIRGIARILGMSVSELESLDKVSLGELEDALPDQPAIDRKKDDRTEESNDAGSHDGDSVSVVESGSPKDKVIPGVRSDGSGAGKIGFREGTDLRNSAPERHSTILPKDAGGGAPRSGMILPVSVVFVVCVVLFIFRPHGKKVEEAGK